MLVERGTSRYDSSTFLLHDTCTTFGKNLHTNISEGHTISQRLRSFKKIPVELLPLGVVLAAAIFAAGYSMIRKFYTDTTLRLYRQGPEATKH